MGLSTVLTAVRDAVAPTAGIDGSAFYPPPTTIAGMPCVIVEAGEGQIDQGATEGEIEVWTHTVKLSIFACEGYRKEMYGQAVDLLGAVTAQFRSQLTLGGIVAVCTPTRYAVGRLTYGLAEYTGATLTLSVEEKFAVDLLP
jgi:hypothetical protein